MQPDDKSYIEELKKSLYSRTAPEVRTRRKLRFEDKPTEMQTDWEHEDVEKPPVELSQKYEDHHMSFFTKLLIASFIFCVLAVGVGAYLFFNGSNLISANNIAIVISGPVSIPGGEPVSFDVTMVNKNSVELQLVDMSVDFPSGTTDPDNPGRVLTSYRKLVGNISSGGSAHQTVNAIIFGEENLQKEITVTLTYGIKGSSSVFTKTQTYDVLINSSPINVSVSSFKEITSGQEFDLKVDMKSNSKEVLKNVLLKANYPFGFTFISSDLKPLSDNATWKIGDISAGGDKKVIIHGKLTGENTDVRAFHFTVGAASANDPKSIGTQYMAVEDDMTIQKPFISMNIAIDNDTSIGDYVGTFGQNERVEIDWFNNLPDTVSNMTITAKLAGNAYDKTTIRPDAGYFDSANDQIVWSRQTNPDFGAVAAGDSGKVSFSITPTDLGTASGNHVVNPTVTYTVSVLGQRTQENNVSGSLSSIATRNTKISSVVSLSGRVVRTTGPFTNTGLIPPKSEKATTYSVIWDVDNTANAVGSTKVTAKLPPNVKWLSAVSPSSEDIRYDTNTGIITWNVGNVGTYTSATSGRREVAFQVSFTPSVTQVGQSPDLVGQASLVAVDKFTNVELSSQQENLTTRYSTDPGYKNGDEFVAK